MSEPSETVVTDMQKFMGVYGQNQYSATLSAVRGSIDRRINRQLFILPIFCKKRNFSEADTQDNFSGLAIRTPTKMSNHYDMGNEEDEDVTNEQADLIYSRDEISVAMNIDPELRSTNLVYGLAYDIHQKDLDELQASVKGEITPGSFIEVLLQLFMERP